MKDNMTSTFHFGSRVQALTFVLLVIGCSDEPKFSQNDFDLVENGNKIGSVHEVLRTSRTARVQVQHNISLNGFEKDQVLALFELDTQGFVTSASYRREGPLGRRYVELRERDGRRFMFSRGDDESIDVALQPIVVMDLMKHVKARNVDVLVLDIVTASVRDGRVDANGTLTLAPVKTVRVDDLVTPQHRARAPFIESETQSIVTWCKTQSAADDAHLLGAITFGILAPRTRRITGTIVRLADDVMAPAPVAP